VPPLSLYIHIPFCHTKCTYCAFNTYTNLNHLIEPFVAALAREIVVVGQSQPKQPLHTIYIGGGTPSLLNQQQIEYILDAVFTHFEVLPNAEISMESNPGDLTQDYLTAVRATGINRLSIGMQSANARELELFARRHDITAVISAVKVAYASGFQNLNLDLIYGIPDQSLADWRHSLDTVLTMQPQHISLYALGLEEGTPLQSWVAHGRLSQPDDDGAVDMYDLATAMLGAAGYVQYEISNWSKPGYECQHNLQYWRNLPYPAFGPGAHGYAGGIRYSTILSPQRYIKALSQIHEQFIFPLSPATDQFTTVDRDTEIAETLIMGLRLTSEGIQRKNFMERFGIDVVDLHQPTIEYFANYGLLFVDDSVVRLTQEGRLLSNVVFRELV
jgi:oxygen-independent coproporphyrinogen III oxidase